MNSSDFTPSDGGPERRTQDGANDSGSGTGAFRCPVPDPFFCGFFASLFKEFVLLIKKKPGRETLRSRMEQGRHVIEIGERIMYKATVLICPGGAYHHLSPRESDPVARAFESCGFDTDILMYTVRTEGAKPLGLTPVRELSERVAALRKERPAQPVYICGFSAGAHLAATLGVHWRTLGLERPDGLILCYPVITADPRWRNEDSIRNLAGEEDASFYSLENHVTADVPPVFLWHTASDGDVPVENSLFFAQALSREKIPFEMHIYPFGAHGLSLATPEVQEPGKDRRPDPHVAGWIDECAAWLDVMLKQK